MCETKMGMSNVCEDILTTVCLPNEIINAEPESIPGFTDLNKQNYEMIVGDMRAEVGLVDTSFSKEAQALMDMAVEELEMTIQEANLFDLSHVTESDQWSLAHDVSKKVSTRINAILREYGDDLESLELKRKNQTTQILLKYKESIAKTSILDYDSIKDIFHAEIDCINRKTISNLQRNADFKLNLQIRCRGMKDTIKQSLKNKAKYFADKEAQHLWQKLQSKQNHKQLVETVYNLRMENAQTRKDIVLATRNLLATRSELSEMLKFSDNVLGVSKLWEDWFEQFNSRLEALYEMCNNLADVLKSDIVILMNNFDEHINSLNRLLLLNLKDCQVQNNIEHISLNTLTDLNDLQINLKKDSDELKFTLNEVVGIIGNKVMQVTAFVGDIKSVWTDYLYSINNMHKQLNLGWEEFNNIYMELKTDLASKIKTQMKNIREAKDLDKLNSVIVDTEKMIDITDEKVDSEFKSHISSLLNLKNKHVEKIIEDMLSSVMNFLNVKYPKDALLHEDIEYNNPIVQSGNSELESHINKCNLYMNAVDNRTLGMYEMLEMCLPNCKDNVVKECDEWLKIFLQDVTYKFNNEHINFLQTQRKIIQDLKTLRSAEIVYHSDRLVSHVNGVKVVIAQLNKGSKDMNTKKQILLNEFIESRAHLIEDMPSDSSMQIKYIITELENTFSVLKQTWENDVTEAKTHCIKQFGNLEHSNTFFSNTAKTFKNGGNYSPEEMKSLNKELKQLEKECNSNKKKLLNSYNELLSGITRHLLDSEIDQLKGKLDQVTLKEVTIDEIRTLRAILRTEVSNLQTFGSNINESINSLFSFPIACEKLVNDIVEVINLRYDYMVFPSEMSSFEPIKINGSNFDSKCTTSLKQSKSKKQSVSKNTTLFINFSDSNITITNNYFSKTKGVLMNKYKSLNQNVREKFGQNVSVKKNNASQSALNSTKQIKESDLIAEYTKGIKSTFLDYNKECELAWYCETKVFIDQIITFRKYVSLLIKRELDMIHKNYKRNLECLRKEYQHKTKSEQNKQAADREMIQQMLVLPLAHPNHQRKLTKLMETASTLCETQNREFTYMVNVYKDDLQNKHNEYVEVVRKLKEKLTKFQSSINNQLSNKLDNLISKVESVSHLVQSDVNQSENEDKNDYSKSIWSDGDCYSCNPLNSSSASADGIEDESEYSAINNAAELVKQSADLIQKLYDEAKLSQNKSEKCILAWVNSFECNIDQCMLVFKSLCD